MHSDFNSNPSSALCINLVILFYVMWILYFTSWSVMCFANVPSSNPWMNDPSADLSPSPLAPFPKIESPPCVYSLSSCCHACGQTFQAFPFCICGSKIWLSITSKNSSDAAIAIILRNVTYEALNPPS